MRILRQPTPSRERRGAALLLSVLVLFVLIAIVYQIRIGTLTDARVGQNDVGLSVIERAIESAKWDVYELLKVDGEESAAGGEEGAAPGPTAGAGEGEGGESEAPTDSSKDEWASVQRTSINEIDLRILVEAENAKYNVLNILNEDEDEAEEAEQRIIRIIDLYREDTEADLSDRDGENMVREMKEYIMERNRGDWPQPELLTHDPENENVFLPMSLRDFLVLESWQPHFFRCYRDENDRRVHSLDQFLTVWSSPGLASEVETGAEGQAAPTPDPDESGEEGDGTDDSESTGEAGEGEAANNQGQGSGATESTGGYGVNLNLAPLAVLAGLFDDRDVRLRFWDDVLEYRNLDEEEEDGEEQDEEPLYDQFNEEIRDKRAFESLDELSEVNSWEDHDPETQSRIMALLETESDVFTIYITARREMSVNGNLSSFADPREKERLEEDPGGALVRTVRTVVWRKSGDDGVEIVPIIPWEVLDYRPFELEDYPDDYY